MQLFFLAVGEGFLRKQRAAQKTFDKSKAAAGANLTQRMGESASGAAEREQGKQTEQRTKPKRIFLAGV